MKSKDRGVGGMAYRSSGLEGYALTMYCILIRQVYTSPLVSNEEGI